MLNRTIWIRYLLTGIGLVLIFVLNQCRVEYIVNADFVHINHTDYYIDYSGLFQLGAYSSNSSTTGGEGDKHPNADTCCQGFLEGLQGDYKQVYVILNDTTGVFYNQDEGPTNLKNYTIKVLGDNHSEYRYQFTDAQFLQAVPCD